MFSTRNASSLPFPRRGQYHCQLFIPRMYQVLPEKHVMPAHKNA